MNCILVPQKDLPSKPFSAVDSNLAKGLTAAVVLLSCGVVWLVQKLRCEKEGWTLNPWLLVLISMPAMILGGASLSAIVAVFGIGVVWNVYGWKDHDEEHHMVEENVEKLQGRGLSQLGYFLMVGGLISPTMLMGAKVWGLALLLLIPDLVGKYLGADLPSQKIMGYDKRYGRLLGILMGIHGEVKIEVGIVAYFAGLIGTTALSAVVISSLLTVLIPYVVGFLYFKGSQDGSAESEPPEEKTVEEKVEVQKPLPTSVPSKAAKKPKPQKKRKGRKRQRKKRAAKK